MSCVNAGVGSKGRGGGGETRKHLGNQFDERAGNRPDTGLINKTMAVLSGQLESISDDRQTQPRPASTRTAKNQRHGGHQRPSEAKSPNQHVRVMWKSIRVFRQPESHKDDLSHPTLEKNTRLVDLISIYAPISYRCHSIISIENI